jgi:hypothetical protein
MTRFSEHIVKSLKQILLHRAPGCVFSEIEIGGLMEGHGLSRAQIECWAENIRYRVKPEDRAKYLSAGPPDGVVSYLIKYALKLWNRSAMRLKQVN